MECKSYWYPTTSSFIGLKTLGTLILILIDRYKLGVLNFSTNIYDLKKRNFVYHHLGLALIHHPLSYPFNSLEMYIYSSNYPWGVSSINSKLDLQNFV